jgi:hypothetical protein
MSDEKAFSGSILRVFEARANQGCADSLTKKFATRRASATIGKVRSSRPDIPTSKNVPSNTSH